MYSLTMIGCGKMGGALLRGWQNNPPYKSLTIIDPTEPSALPKGAIYASTLDHSKAWEQTPDVILLAVKPLMLNKICTQVVPKIKPSTLIITVAAGWTLADYAACFGPTQPVIRTIPNTPAAIGKGITALIGNASTSQTHIDWTRQAFEAVGDTILLGDESQMDAVMAIASSGPAYLFYLVEVLTASGIKMGLSADMAAKLARQMVTGSAALLDHYSATSPESLRGQVTSPNGTTHAAITTLQKDARLQNLFDEALKAAVARAQQMRTET